MGGTCAFGEEPKAEAAKLPGAAIGPSSAQKMSGKKRALIEISKTWHQRLVWARLRAEQSLHVRESLVGIRHRAGAGKVCVP